MYAQFDATFRRPVEPAHRRRRRPTAGTGRGTMPRRSVGPPGNARRPTAFWFPWRSVRERVRRMYKYTLYGKYVSIPFLNSVK